MKKYFIYLTENLINGRKYVGKHYGTEDDSYIGSGIRVCHSVKKYGRAHFSRIILEYGNKETINDLEKKWILKFNACEDDFFYNISKGGDGGDLISMLPSEDKKRISKIRSVNAKRIRQNKELEEQRNNQLKETMSAKSPEWKKERYEEQSGTKHYSARIVSTPDGVFEMATVAAEHYKVNVQTILNRCKNANFIDWEFIDKK